MNSTNSSTTPGPLVVAYYKTTLTKARRWVTLSVIFCENRPFFKENGMEVGKTVDPKRGRETRSREEEIRRDKIRRRGGWQAGAGDESGGQHIH